jgi:hypothetical protein
MIELVALFVIVISVILCIVSAMYKCTDGTMDTNDFSMETCIKLGDGTSDSPKTASNVVSEEQISSSPLLSGSGVSDALFGSGLSEGDEDIDYSSYIDYYRVSNDGVKVNTYIDADDDGEPDFVDSVEVEAFGPGECAKICYENTEDIGGYECNAFKMNPTGAKCTLYWSQSESGVTENENVFRLKVPRSPSTHSEEALTNIESENGSGYDVIFYNSPGYQKPGIDLDGKIFFRDGAPGNSYYGFALDSPKSIYIPGDKCVKTFDEIGGSGTGNETEYTMSQPDLSGETIGSLMIGSVNKSLGRCEYPSASEVASTYEVIADSGVEAFYVTSGNGWDTISSVEDERPMVHYTTRCIGDSPSMDQHCTDKLTYESCVNHTVGPTSENVCTWQG